VDVDKADLEMEQVKPVSNKLAGKIFLFTGVRDASLEEVIVKNGGQVVGGFSSKVTHLVVKDLGTSSSKAQAAQKAGIPIITLDQAWKLTGTKKG
jgi:NAD-dependent DNA ligase